METLIENIRYASVPVQAVAVTVGGLIGVFATLTVFYILIRIANRFGESGGKSDQSD